MLYVCFEEPVLFLHGRVSALVESIRFGGGVVIITPFCLRMVNLDSLEGKLSEAYEMVRKF